MAIISSSVPAVDKVVSFRLEGDLPNSAYRVVETLMQVPVPAISTAGGSQSVSIPVAVSSLAIINATSNNGFVNMSAIPQGNGTINLLANAFPGQTAAASVAYLSIKDFELYK